MSRATRPDKRPPSRLRYEESHPVVTLRLPLDVYTRFKEATTAMGASAASWVKEHLDQDDTQAQAIAGELAREREGLGREIERRRRELDSLDALVKKRKEEIAASREAEQEKMLKEVAIERESRLEYVAVEVQLARDRKMASLASLDAEIVAKKKEFGNLVGDIAGQRFELNLIETELKDRQRLRERLAREAVEQLRQKGGA